MKNELLVFAGGALVGLCARGAPDWTWSIAVGVTGVAVASVVGWMASQRQAAERLEHQRSLMRASQKEFGEIVLQKMRRVVKITANTVAARMAKECARSGNEEQLEAAQARAVEIATEQLLTFDEAYSSAKLDLEGEKSPENI